MDRSLEGFIQRATGQSTSVCGLGQEDCRVGLSDSVKPGFDSLQRTAGARVENVSIMN